MIDPTRDVPPQVRRVRKLQLAVIGAMVLLLCRLGQLQLLRGEDYVERAEATRRRVVWREPVRGPILDRHGVELASSRPLYDVVASPNEVDPLVKLSGRIGWALRLRSDTAEDRTRRQRAIYLAFERGERALRVQAHPDAVKRLYSMARHRQLALELEGPDLLEDGSLSVPTDREPTTITAVLTVPFSAMQQRGRVLDTLAAVIGADRAELAAAFADAVEHGQTADEPGERQARLRQSHVIAADVGFDAAARLEEAISQDLLPGVSLRIGTERRWPLGEVAAHLVGRTNEVNAEQMERFRREGRLLDRRPREGDARSPAPAPGDADGELLARSGARRPRRGDRLFRDPIGKSGLERGRDDALHGVPGVELVERDAFGRTRRVLVSIPPIDGRPLHTSLDVAFQAEVERLLDEAVAAHAVEGAGGAAVFIDARDGSILALASSPRYDPSTFSEDYRENVARPDNPLVHRAVKAFTPGSTFKPLVGLAAGEIGREGPAFDPHAKIVCNGRYSPDSRAFSCWNRSGHGPVDLAEAIEGSCNIYFMKLAEQIGPFAVAGLADRLGFGRSARLGLPGESAGNLPRPGMGWQVGKTRNMSIGQGRMLATPLQIARLAATVGRGSPPPASRLVLDDAAPAAPAADARFAPATLAALQRGMRGAAHTRHRGTASNPEIGLSKLDVSVKTGTAQLGPTINAAWTMGYAPSEAPAVAFAIVIERTRAHGGDAAGPVAAGALEWLRRPREEQTARRETERTEAPR